MPEGSAGRNLFPRSCGAVDRFDDRDRFPRFPAVRVHGHAGGHVLRGQMPPSGLHADKDLQRQQLQFPQYVEMCRMRMKNVPPGGGTPFDLSIALR